jgi:hypothetical protein
MNLTRKITNYILHGKWTDCRHENRKPHGWYGEWDCLDCGADG